MTKNKDKEYTVVVEINSIDVSNCSTFFYIYKYMLLFFSTSHALKTWFELSRVNIEMI